jgi:hypothetical protein
MHGQKNIKFKETYFDTVIYPSADCSHCNQLTNSRLDFWTIDLKTWDILDDINKNKKIILCDLECDSVQSGRNSSKFSGITVYSIPYPDDASKRYVTTECR